MVDKFANVVYWIVVGIGCVLLFLWLGNSLLAWGAVACFGLIRWVHGRSPAVTRIDNLSLGEKRAAAQPDDRK